MAFGFRKFNCKYASTLALLSAGAFLLLNSQAWATAPTKNASGVNLSKSNVGDTTLQIAAEPRTGVNRRVQFARGRSSTTIKGAVPLGKKDTYIFRARKGQTIITEVVWEGDRVGGDNDDQGLSGFSFVWPNGEVFQDPQDGYFEATSTGDYRVVVAQPYKLTSSRYTFKLTIR
ncbi:hypothetical protein [Coleofasciculus sp. H7-2]|uniref:hypothetical protein n=1 Tax=Coleofasciculus sp. H7-2 TaxID=3351545 RepID=UPI00366BAC52